jgi:hypothetical protein
MDWHCGASAVRMLKEMVAAFLANDLESRFSKSFDESLARNGGKSAHALTATR